MNVWWSSHGNAVAIACGLPTGRRRAHITGGGFDLPAVGPHFDEFVAQAGLD
jgi:hypothetical protein